MGNTLVEYMSNRRWPIGAAGEVMNISHIHLPDGVLPWSWWLLADLLAAAWLLLALRRERSASRRPRLPLLGALGACMLLTMSVPLGPLPLHLNLTVITGILAGPWLGFITVFLVNVLLSLLGHGGLTVLGLNSLLMGMEVAVGWWAFHRLGRGWSINWRAIFAPLLALLLSISLSFGVIGWSTGDWSASLPHSHAESNQHQHELAVQSVDGASQHEHGLSSVLSEWGMLGQTGLAALALLFTLGLLSESAATLVIARYIQQVQPELLQRECE